MPIVTKVNTLLEGFRTVLLAAAGYALLFVDVTLTNMTGLSKEALKGAALMAVLITAKQIKTDVLPALRAKLEAAKGAE